MEICSTLDPFFFHEMRDEFAAASCQRISYGSKNFYVVKLV